MSLVLGTAPRQARTPPDLKNVRWIYKEAPMVGVYIGIVVVLAMNVVSGLILVNLLKLNLEATRGVKAFLEKQALERLHMKCNGLFSRLLRALEKNKAYIAPIRVDHTSMSLLWYDIWVRVAVNPELGAFQQGQFTASVDDNPMIVIAGCEQDLPEFARRIRELFDMTHAIRIRKEMRVPPPSDTHPPQNAA